MSQVVGAIQDWIDPDDRLHLQGAEDDFYQGLTPPYFAKNGPIDDLSELLLVRGVTPELFWGGVSTNHPPPAFQRRAGGRFFQPGELPAFPFGLVDVFTPLSAGKINVNTASAETLQLIPGVDRVVADAIVSGRAGEDDGSGMMGPYRNVAQVGRMPEVNPALLRAIQQYGDVRSYTFEVEIDARIGSYSRKFIGIIGRSRGNARDLQLLSFRWK
jgi:type II secretory pathway component PulK